MFTSESIKKCSRCFSVQKNGNISFEIRNLYLLSTGRERFLLVDCKGFADTEVIEFTPPWLYTYYGHCTGSNRTYRVQSLARWGLSGWWGRDTEMTQQTDISRSSETRSDLISMSSPTTILYLIVSVMISIRSSNDAIICPDQSGSSFNESNLCAAHCPLGEYSEASSTPIYQHPWT